MRFSSPPERQHASEVWSRTFRPLRDAATGCVSGDWQTAKLMISLMWTSTLLISALAFAACNRRYAVR